MKFTLIPDHENSFKSTLTDSSEKKFTLKETIDLGDGISIHRIAPAINSGFYYAEKTPKSMIVIHSTIGVVKGDIATLTNASNPVSVSYLIARSGVIYELFDPHYWSYHLGKGTIGGNKVNSSRSIGIELSNMGPLTNINGALETVYSRKSYTTNGITKTTSPDVYCTTNDLSAFTKLDVPYRTYQYFAAYTDAQYIALNKLVRRLSTQFNIPMVYVNESNRFRPFTESVAPTFSGICSHVNYRIDGKWDVGPDFKWDRIITEYSAVKAPITQPTPDIKNEPVANEPVIISKSTGLPPFLPQAQPVIKQEQPIKSIFSTIVKRFLK